MILPDFMQSKRPSAKTSLVPQGGGADKKLDIIIILNRIFTDNKRRYFV